MSKTKVKTSLHLLDMFSLFSISGLIMYVSCPSARAQQLRIKLTSPLHLACYIKLVTTSHFTETLVFQQHLLGPRTGAAQPCPLHHSLHRHHTAPRTSTTQGSQDSQRNSPVLCSSRPSSIFSPHSSSMVVSFALCDDLSVVPLPFQT